LVDFKTLPHGKFEEIQFWKQPTLRCQIVLLRDSKDFSNLFDETQVSFSKIGQFLCLDTNQTSLYSRQKKQDKKEEKSKPGRPTTLTEEQENT
jgi:hypothetical protein